MNYEMKMIKKCADSGIIKDMLKEYDTKYDYEKDIKNCIDEITDVLDDLKEHYFPDLKRTGRHLGSNYRAKYLLKELCNIYDTLWNLTNELHEMEFDYGAELGRDYTQINEQINADYLDIHYAVLDKQNEICVYGKTVEDTKAKANEYFKTCKNNLNPEEILCCGYTYEQAVKKVEKDRELYKLHNEKIYEDYTEYANIDGYKLIAIPDEVWKEYILQFANYWIYDDAEGYDKYYNFWKKSHNQPKSIGCE